MAESNLQKAKEQAKQARTQLEAQRKMAKAASEQLVVAEKKLPSRTSATALRTGSTSGLNGRRQRVQIKKIEEKIGGEIAKVSEFKKELSKFEEEKLKPVEKQIKEAEEYEAAIKIVQSAASKGKLGLIAEYGKGLEKKLAKKYLKEMELQKESQSKVIDISEKVNISGVDSLTSSEKKKLDIALKTGALKIDGKITGDRNDVKSLKDYNNYLKSVKPEEIKVSEIAPVKLDSKIEQVRVRDKKTFIQKVGDFLTLPGVSAVSSKTKDLKRTDTTKVNDIGLSDRVLNRYGERLAVVSSVGTRVADFISDISEGDKQGFKEQVFKGTGSVVSAYDPSKEVETYIPQEKTLGQKIIDLPSKGLESAREFSSRQASLSSAESLLGGVSEISGKKVASISQPNVREIREVRQLEKDVGASYKKFQEIEYSRIPKFELENQLDGRFDYSKLSREKQQEYNRLQQERNRYVKEYEDVSKRYGERVGDTSKTFRFYQEERVVPVTKLTSPFGYVGEYTSTITQTAGKGIGLLYGDIAKQTGKISKAPFQAVGQVLTGEITGKEFVSGFKDKKPGMVLDLMTGESRVPKPTDTKNTEGLMFVQPTEVSAVATGVFEGAKYLLPVAGSAIFAAEVGEELSQVGYSPSRFIKEKPIQAAVLGGTLLTLGLIGGVQALKGAAIEKAIGKEIKLLEDKRVTSLTLVGEREGLAVGFGEAKAGRSVKRVEYAGRVMETEGGKVFVPTGEGAMVISGEVAPKVLGVRLNPRKFVAGTEFELGSKGGGVLLGEKGSVKLFEEIGVTTIIPKKDVFGIVKLDRTGATKKDILGLESQLKKRTQSRAEVIKDIQLPIGQRNLLLESGDVGVRISPSEIGTVVRLPKSKQVINLGAKGRGEKSSSQYFDDLYKPQELVKPEIKVDIPSVGDISAGLKIKPSIIKTEPMGSLPIAASEFVGTGLYERTEQIISPMTLAPKTMPSLTKPVIQTPTAKLDTFVKFEPVVKVKEKQSLGLKDELFQGEVMKQSFGLKESLVQGQSMKQSLGLKEELVQREKGKQVLDSFSRQSLRPSVKASTKPKLKVKVKVKAATPAKDFIKSIATSGAFKIFAKKGDVDIEIGTAKTEEEAKGVLTTKLKETLRASGFIEKAGKKIRISQLGEGFRRSKTDVFRIVEEKERRIKRKGKSQEAKEIQFFRGKSKKRLL